MEIDRSRVTNIQELSGNGVIATVDDHQVAAGNDKLMNRLGVQAIPCHSVGTIIHMAIDGKYAGHIVISDIVKPQKGSHPGIKVGWGSQDCDAYW